jgi:hypothetical protein
VTIRHHGRALRLSPDETSPVTIPEDTTLYRHSSVLTDLDHTPEPDPRLQARPVGPVRVCLFCGERIVRPAGR